MSSSFDFDGAVRMAGGRPVVEVAQLSGDANETYVADLSDGDRLVIRILHTLTPERARQEVAVQQALSAAGITTPISLTLQHGDVVGAVSGLDFTVSHFIEGQHPSTITEALEHDFGRMLAHFHRATAGLVIDMQGWLSPALVATEAARVEDDEFRQGLVEMQSRASAIFDSALPTANIHGDVWPGNVFADRGQITAVLDLETVERAPRILDIGRTAVAIVIESSRDPFVVLATLASAYDTLQTLDPIERELLPLAYQHATIASAAWNFRNGHPDLARDLFKRAQEVAHEAG